MRGERQQHGSGGGGRGGDQVVANVGEGIEHLRAVPSGRQVPHVQQQLGFSVVTDFEHWSTFTPGPQDEEAAPALFGRLERWARALKAVRAAQARGPRQQAVSAASPA